MGSLQGQKNDQFLQILEHSIENNKASMIFTYLELLQ